MAVRAPGEAPSFRRALSHRPLALLWASQLISQSGDFVFEVALLWLVLQITGSVLAVGIVVTATLVPIVILSPTLGVYVDRWDRRRILLYTNVLEGVAVALLSALVITHTTSLDILVVVVLGLSSAAQLVRITSSALVPQTVGVDDLPAANGLMSFSTSFNQIVGLSIGGVVVGLFGVSLPIEYDAVSFFLAAGLLALIPSGVGRPEPASMGTAPSFWDQFREGFRYTRDQRYLVEVISIGMVLNFFANAITALLAPYAARVLHGGAATYGLLGASIAAGALVGALAIGKVNTRTTAGYYLFGGLAGVGALFVALGITRSVPLALAEAALLGVVISVTNVPLLTLIQAKVPGRLMGRVMATLSSLVLVVSPIGSFFAGALASATSIPTVFVLFGLLMLIVQGIGFGTLRTLRTVAY